MRHALLICNTCKTETPRISKQHSTAWQQGLACTTKLKVAGWESKPPCPKRCSAARVSAAWLPLFSRPSSCASLACKAQHA